MPANAQEFLSSVTVTAPAVNNIDPQVFTQMQRDIQEYINNTRFTEHVFNAEERLRVRVQIIINSAPSNERFEGTITFQAKRPVFGSTYETMLYNVNDRHFRVGYVPFQPLQYSENSFVDNLTSLLNFHCLMMLGFDYDSFKLEDGVPLLDRARNVMNLAQGSQEPGWTALDDPNQGRYWLLENMLNNSYGVLHKIYYKYHRAGLDVMATDFPTGVQAVMAALEDMNQLFTQNPNIYMLRVFLDAKRQELIQIFTNAFAEDKQKFVRIMNTLDPRNASNYAVVLAQDRQR